MSQPSTWRPTGGPECLGSVQLLSVESFSEDEQTPATLESPAESAQNVLNHTQAPSRFKDRRHANAPKFSLGDLPKRDLRPMSDCLGYSEDDQTPATFPRPFESQRMGQSTCTGCGAPVDVDSGPSLHTGQMPAAYPMPDAGSGCHRLFIGQIPLFATIYQVLGPTTDEPDAQQLLDEIDRLREERSTWRQRWEEEHQQLAMFKALIKSQSNPNLLDDPPSSTPSFPGSSKSESHQSGPTSSSGSLAAHPLPFYGEQCLPSPSSVVGVVSSAISA